MPHSPHVDSRHPMRARGFSLVELLVVMAVIAFLVVLLLPALQQVREAARRAACRHNLRQIGLALQQYEVAHGVLPPGSLNETGPIRTAPSGYHHGWYTMLLPFLDAGPLYLNLDPTAGLYDDRNAAVRRTELPILYCPSDPGPRFSIRDDDIAAALTNYAGSHHPSPAPIDVTNHGVLFLNSRVRYEDIPDGSSHTIFVGEFVRDANDLGWASGTFASLRNSGWAIAGSQPATAIAGEDLSLDACGFGSHHAGGGHFCFGDGSVRFNPSGASLQSMLDRADEPLTFEFIEP